MTPSDELKQIADTLVANCRAGKDRDNLDALYADDAVSVEAMVQPGDDIEKRGLKALHAKHDWWEAQMEPVESKVMGPFYNGPDRFAVIFDFTVKEKASGNVIAMQEVALYHVDHGKIVREEFFYELQPPQ